MNSDAKRDVWIEAGLAEMARHGIDGVRVEVLAKNLGVTKGGFYRRFKDRAALLDGILGTWSAGRIASIASRMSSSAVARSSGMQAPSGTAVNTPSIAGVPARPGNVSRRSRRSRHFDENLHR